MKLKFLTLSVTALAIAACSQAEKAADTTAEVTTETVETVDEAVTEVAESVEDAVDGPSLDSVLDMQSDAMKARYDARNPGKTLAYLGVEPGMTVAEILPGGGWYSKILLPYLGDEGALIGVDYSIPMWSKFGGFADEEFLEDRKSWAQTWSADAAKWRAGSNADIQAFAFGSMPEDLKGTVDVVFFARAMHHLKPF